MNLEIWRGVLVPFAGTSMGAACVFVMKGALNRAVQRTLYGFAAGVMAAASVWSLLLPAIERAEGLGRWAFAPAAGGFWMGVLFLLALGRLIDRLERRLDPERRRTGLLALAVTLHNLPEGMAVGAAYAGLMSGAGTAAGAMALALGIAIQNFPEGAIISMPLRAEGCGRGRAFWGGVLSGAVEPVAALATIWLSGLVVPLMPYCLSFAAGAMLCVTAADLLPEAASGGRGAAAVSFSLGFTVMMALDVMLG